MKQKDLLIENHIFAFKEFMFFKIIKSPHFLTIRITHKNTPRTSGWKFLSSFVILGKAQSSKTLRWSKLGFLWKSTSQGVLLWRSLVRVLFIRYAAVRTHSPYKHNGRLAWKHSALATFKICLCFRSTLPLYWGVSTQLVWCNIFFCIKTFHGSLFEFQPIITSKHFNIFPELSFGYGSKGF